MLQKGMVFFKVLSEAPEVTATRRSIKENYIETKNTISQAINRNPFLGLLMVGGVVEVLLE